MSHFFNEFKAFAMKGNVIDLAVGIVIGTAFGKIVSSLVADIVMPLVGALTAGVDFKDLSYTLPALPWTQEAIELPYGLFLQHLFDFVIVAFAIFLLVKAINSAKERMKRKEQKEDIKEEIKEAIAPKLTMDQELLVDIRDLLKNLPKK